MRIVRRLYYYVITFVSLEVVLWGLIGLGRSLFCGREMVACGNASILARGLALILVGVPVFSFHWWMVERFARQDEEERASSVRAVFLYAAMLGTLIPIVQNALSLLDRLVLQAAGLSPSQAVFGPGQTWSDNLIAMLMNAIAAAYFLKILRRDWRLMVSNNSASQDPGALLKGLGIFTDVRRIYRHAWLLYSLGIVVAAVQQLLHFLLNSLPGGFTFAYRASGAHGVALAVIGLPLWYFAWKTVQDALVSQEERASLLRLGVLYLLSLAGVVTVLAAAGMLVELSLRVLLGESMTFSSFIQKLAGPLSIGIPLAGVWAYYGHWLGRAMAESAEADTAETPRRAGMRRLYAYILSAVGLSTTFIGLGMLLAFVVDAAVGNIVWANLLRPRLAGALAVLSVGLPLWWLAWRPMQMEAQAAAQSAVGQGLAQAGDHARRSIIRKVYLYLALFASVVGGMITAVSALNLLLGSLFGNPVENLLQQVLHNLEYLALFIGLGVYHGSMLGRDGRLASRALAEKHAAFPVLVFDPGDGSFGQVIQAAFHRQVPSLPVVIQPADQPVRKDAAPQAVLIPGELALNPPETLRTWLDEYKGSKLVIPQAAQGWLWAGGIRPLPAAAIQAAQAVRQLAEGQEVRQQAGTSGWMIVLYILAGLFGLEILGLLLSLGISRLVG